LFSWVFWFYILTAFHLCYSDTSQTLPNKYRIQNRYRCASDTVRVRIGYATCISNYSIQFDCQIRSSICLDTSGYDLSSVRVRLDTFQILLYPTYHICCRTNCATWIPIRDQSATRILNNWSKLPKNQGFKGTRTRTSTLYAFLPATTLATLMC
jgi:hypothetical protein